MNEHIRMMKTRDVKSAPNYTRSNSAGLFPETGKKDYRGLLLIINEGKQSLHGKEEFILSKIYEVIKHSPPQK